jgi:hypothetical protein
MNLSPKLVAASVFVAALWALPAAAQLPDAHALLGDLGFSADQIQQVIRGEIVRGAIQAASDRELVVAMAFQVPTTPAKFVADLKAGLGIKVDPGTLSSGVFSSGGSAADLAGLALDPDGEKRAKAYVNAQPGGDLNLSTGEYATFNALAPSPAAVTPAVRAALLARTQAYQKQGLAGIAPYALGDGKTRSAADELRTATQASKALQKYLPSAYQMLLDYPAAQPAGTENLFRWAQIDAHGVPTLTLTHSAYVPDGDAFFVVQRMFYVSSGFNAEQAIAAVLPVQGGSVVVYANRTSTDQVTGFGGSVKRSIGSQLLESQLEGIFQKARASLTK